MVEESARQCCNIQFPLCISRMSTCLCAWIVYLSAIILCLVVSSSFHSISSISECPLVHVHRTCIYQVLLLFGFLCSFSFNSIPFLPSQSVHLFMCIGRVSIKSFCFLVSSAQSFNSIPFLPSQSVHLFMCIGHVSIKSFCFLGSSALSLSIPFHFFHLRVSTCSCA